MKKPVQIIRMGYVLVLWMTACAPIPPAQTPAPTLTKSPTPTIEITPTIPPGAQQYLSDAIDIIEKYALNSKKVDWTEMRAKAFQLEKDATTPEDTYDTISYVLRQLGDQHSSFRTSQMAKQVDNSTVEDYLQPRGKLIKDRIGYIAVFTFGSKLEDQMNKYADEIQDAIIELNEQPVCGWIVDLRANQGGNMWPMVAGLGALIGEGELGAFKNATGHITKWYYNDGQSWEENMPMATVSHPDFLLDPNETPVAILIGSSTASSGEATAIAFRGRPNTRFFGQPSLGLTTANVAIKLSDGAVIVLAVATEMDRTGQEYVGRIIPDVETSKPESEATGWLLAQPACQK